MNPFVFWTCAIFGTSPFFPAFIQRKVSSEASEIYLWTISAFALFIFATSMALLKSGALFEKTGNIMALTFSSLLAALVGVSGTMAINGSKPGAELFKLATGQAAEILILLTLLSCIAQVLLNNRIDEIRGGDR